MRSKKIALELEQLALQEARQKKLRERGIGNRQLLSARGKSDVFGRIGFLVDRMGIGQKMVLIVFLFMTLLLVALHNPFGGYLTRSWHKDVTRSFFAYKSRNSMVRCVDSIGELSGLWSSLFVFTAISFRILKPASSHQNVENACPKGHGPLKPWEGKLRCWVCGYREQ